MHSHPSEAAIKEAQRLADELKQHWPSEFTLSATLARHGKKQYPDLHFVADAEIPGLYEAKVDPDFIMSRGRNGSDEAIQRASSP